MSINGIKGDHTIAGKRGNRNSRHILVHFTRYILPVLLALFLLMGCGSITGANAQPEAKETLSTATHPTATPTPANLATSLCPADLQNVTTCYTPQVFRAAYGVDKLIQQGITGKGQTVIDIVSFGSPTLQQDMNVYDKQFGLPAVNLQIIAPLSDKPYDPNGDRPGWAGETTLDVEIIHAIAPDAKIVVLVSPVAETEGTIGLPQFRQLEQYTIDHKLGNIVSQSWAASELTLKDTAGQQELQKWETLYQKATTQQGITYLSSSGDNGATDYQDLQAKHIASVPTTGFPTDSPWVTSVGGTTLTRTGTATFNEEAWTGSGGGFSSFYKTPSYQQTLPAAKQQQLQGKRGVPDVSGAANPSTGLVIYQGGAWQMIGGTSASAPLWAGIVALANQMAGHPLGFINPGLYKLAASSNYARDFNDITVGNNTNTSANVQGYPAVTGWDPVTGLGSAKAENLVPDLIAALK